MAAAVMCPGTVWSEMRSIPRQERQFLLQLQALLKQLDPSARRRVITERLTQAQRLALERYMLTAQKCRATRLACNARKKVLKASNRGRARKLRFARRAFNEDNPRDAAGESRHLSSSHPELPPNGRKACVHLGRGFYAHCKLDASAQEAFCSLGDVALQLAGQSLRQGEFEAAVTAAVAKAEETGAHLRLLFRTRITFSRAARLSTPLRGNLAAALEDWHAVRSARGEARADRLQRHEMAAVWRHTSAAWTSIWQQKGFVPDRLKRQLARKEALCEPLSQQPLATGQDPGRQRSAVEEAQQQIDKLLAWQARQRADHNVPARHKTAKGSFAKLGRWQCRPGCLSRLPSARNIGPRNRVFHT